MNEAQRKAKADNAEAARRRREAEREDALDFLMHGDADGRHSDKCIHEEPCSRDYNTMPYPDALPDAKHYAGTGIGALYGFENTERFLWRLAGWNVTKRKEH